MRTDSALIEKHPRIPIIRYFGHIGKVIFVIKAHDVAIYIAFRVRTEPRRKIIIIIIRQALVAPKIDFVTSNNAYIAVIGGPRRIVLLVYQSAIVFKRNAPVFYCLIAQWHFLAVVDNT